MTDRRVLSKEAADGFYAFTLTQTAVKTAGYAAQNNEMIPVDTTSGPITIMLPVAAPDRTRVVVKHIVQGGANAVTVSCGSTDVLNRVGGPVSTTLALLGQSSQFQYQAAAGIWMVTANDLPLSQLDLRFGSASVSVLTKTATYAMATADAVVLANGTFTVTLPVAPTVGKTYRVKNIGTGVITVAPSSGTIDGAANASLATRYQSQDYMSDGTNWWVV